jgi:hypothetical protein
MSPRLQKIADYMLDRIGEASTWQGVGFIVGACGSKFGAGMDWGQAAFIGGLVSGLIKTAFPDLFRSK